MNILIFADKRNKRVCQELLDWAKTTHIRFTLTFTTDKDKMESVLKYTKYSIIVSFNRPANFYLNKKNIKCISINDSWYSAAKKVL